MGLIIIGCNEISLVAWKLEMIKHSQMCKCLALLLHCSGHDSVHLKLGGLDHLLWRNSFTGDCFSTTRSLGNGLVKPTTSTLSYVYLKVRSNPKVYKELFLFNQSAIPLNSEGWSIFRRYDFNAFFSSNNRQWQTLSRVLFDEG